MLANHDEKLFLNISGIVNAVWYLYKQNTMTVMLPCFEREIVIVNTVEAQCACFCHKICTMLILICCMHFREFAISYLAKDDYGQETYLSLLSDWDLDAAFLSASDPCLRLKVDLKPFEEG